MLGQTSFTSYITDSTSATLNSPTGVALTADAVNPAKTNTGWLVVTDAAQNRALLFQKPFVSGMSATVVLGQKSFTSGAATSTAAGLSSPRGVAVDPQDRVIVADTSNTRRVEVFDVARESLANGAKPPLISLAPGFSNPLGVSVGPAGDFWVVDISATD